MHPTIANRAYIIGCYAGAPAATPHSLQAGARTCHTGKLALDHIHGLPIFYALQWIVTETILMSLSGLSHLSVRAASIWWITSYPDVATPKILRNSKQVQAHQRWALLPPDLESKCIEKETHVCAMLRCGVGVVVMKNCEPFVLVPLPALAIASTYGRSNLSVVVTSSAKFLPQIDSPPVPSPSGSPVRSVHPDQAKRVRSADSPRQKRTQCKKKTRREKERQRTARTRLQHEFLDDAVEDDAFVVRAPRVPDKVLDRLGRSVRVQRELNVAQGRVQRGRRRLRGHLGRRRRGRRRDRRFFARRLLVEDVPVRLCVPARSETEKARSARCMTLRMRGGK